METIFRTHWGERIIVNLVHMLQRYPIIKFNPGPFSHAGVVIATEQTLVFREPVPYPSNNL